MNTYPGFLKSSPFAVLLGGMLSVLTACGTIGGGDVFGLYEAAPRLMERAREAQSGEIPEPWMTPPIRPSGFLFEIQSANHPPFSDLSVNLAVKHYGLGETTRHQFFGGSAEEWGYSFNNLKNGALDGAGRPHYGGYPSPPTDRAEALAVMRDYVLSTYMPGASRPWNSMNGHYPFHHYAGEWGFDVLGSEIGENMNSYQMLIAFNRGAARQYRTPWFVDFSSWHGPGITDFSAVKVWGNYSGPDNGHSLSLHKRSYIVSYMSGAGAVVAEAGGINFFTEKRNAEGFLTLSPLGEVGMVFNDFVTDFPDRGVPYTPFAVVVDYYHGTYSATTASKKAFDYFPYGKGDYTTWQLLDLFFPGGWVSGAGNEKDVLTETPFGDTCDVLLQNASAELLASYPVVILTGEITLGPVEKKRFAEYVWNGGILLVNELTIEQFPRYLTGSLTDAGTGAVGSYGTGLVVHYGDPTRDKKATGEILAALAEALLPFRVDGKVQYSINRKERSWVITLVNNEGITKAFHGPPVIDVSQTQHVSVAFTGSGTPGDIVVRYADAASTVRLSPSPGRAEVTLHPGELTVLEFQLD